MFNGTNTNNRKFWTNSCCTTHANTLTLYSRLTKYSSISCDFVLCLWMISKEAEIKKNRRATMKYSCDGCEFFLKCCLDESFRSMHTATIKSCLSLCDLLYLHFIIIFFTILLLDIVLSCCLSPALFLSFLSQTFLVFLTLCEHLKKEPTKWRKQKVGWSNRFLMQTDVWLLN